MRKVTKAHVKLEEPTDIRLWETATYLLRTGLEHERGCHHFFLASIVFAFLSFEAYLNELGRNLLPEMWAAERENFGKGKDRGTAGKFKVIARKTRFSFDPKARPYITFVELGAVRDKLVHAKVYLLEAVVAASRAEATVAKSELDKWGSAKFAERALKDIKALAEGLMESSKANIGEYEAGFRSSAFRGTNRVWSIITLDS